MGTRSGCLNEPPIERVEGGDHCRLLADRETANQHPGGEREFLSLGKQLVTFGGVKRSEQGLDHIIKISGEAVAPLPAARRLVP